MSRKIPISLRRLVAQRANYCCEYCRIPESDSFFDFELDHILSLKHGGETTESNLSYSCFPCNNNKGSDIGTVLLPDRQIVRLYDPRQDKWEDHFEMEQCVIYAKSKIGEATTKLLKFNEVDRIIERRVIYGEID